MSCINAKWIYKEGYYKELNWRTVYTGKDYYEVGCWSKCGTCENCMNEKANNWLVRNYFEEKRHAKKSFITLTYEHSPLILVKKDLQDYIKRLRTNLDRSTGEKIKIFTAGEYGDSKKRPHFHVIIYGWQDENAKYLNVNKKGNVYYQSDLIHDTWGKGRTSYQKFDTNEIAYLSLYNTPNEIYKKEYLLNKSSLKKLESYAYSNITHLNKNLLKEIEMLRKKVEESKSGYIAIKEFNTWSQSLGWEMFEKEYINSKEYAFEHYIKDGTFVTPTPWIKKLANKYGDVRAMQELIRREENMVRETNEAKYKGKILIEQATKKKREILEWNDTKKTGKGIL